MTVLESTDCNLFTLQWLVRIGTVGESIQKKFAGSFLAPGSIPPEASRPVTNYPELIGSLLLTPTSSPRRLVAWDKLTLFARDGGTSHRTLLYSTFCNPFADQTTSLILSRRLTYSNVCCVVILTSWLRLEHLLPRAECVVPTRPFVKTARKRSLVAIVCLSPPEGEHFVV